MKKILSAILVVTLSALCLLAGCGKKSTITIAVPNDTTNEARALLLLESLGYIEIDDSVGINATIQNITKNPKNIEFKELEAAQIPRVLEEVDFAIINSNYAISAGLNPVKDAFKMEGSASAYSNILAVKEGNEKEPKILALVAALQSQEVKDFIEKTYGGSVVSTADVITDGYSSDIDYAALKGATVSVAASPTPHAEILEIAKTILAAKDITLEITTFEDYVLPNEVVESGEIDANYFQHVPYLDSFNAEKGTHIVSVAAIHVEPMGLYGGKQKSLDVLK